MKVIPIRRQWFACWMLVQAISALMWAREGNLVMAIGSVLVFVCMCMIYQSAQATPAGTRD